MSLQPSVIRKDEIISPAATRIGDRLLNVTVGTGNQERRLFLFLDTKSTGDFILYGAVKMYKGENLVGEYPAGLCSFTNGDLAPNQSVMNCFSTGGSAVGDSLILQLAKPFDATLPTVVCQPLRVNADIDNISFGIEAFAGLIQGFRAFLGCLSTPY
ncbi:MAG TPA: hypothetical protein VFC07_00965 [Verrucomicrobiae bacterium]|nr:hypothetical protein [Verrucomicrobiae bacterium]